MARATDGLNLYEETYMWFLTDPIFWGLIAVAVGLHLWNKADDKRHIRDLLAKNDEMWNDLIAQHQQAIAEAYQQGKGFQINIDRR